MSGEAPDDLEDQQVIQEFIDTEARGEIEWVSNEEMSSLMDAVIAEAEGRE